MPKDYNSLYEDLSRKFPEQISQNEDSIIQQVCHICVYLDGLNSKGTKVNFPFWGEVKIGGSTTFLRKLSHFRRILSGFLDRGYLNLSDLPTFSKEFDITVTGNSSFKTSRQYKQLIINLIETVDTMGNGAKVDCLQICKNFVDEQFPDTSVTNSSHPNCSV